MIKQTLGAALTLLATAGLVSIAAPAGAGPRVPDRPNGVTVRQAQRAATEPFGDCAVAGVTCKPDLAGSCTGNVAQDTPPASIRVYDPSYPGANHIRVVAFETYVEDVVPNEWADSWDGDALKAGAVAITSYAWYWVTHYGGYVGPTPTSSTCFDVTSDENFQVFVNASAKPNSTAKVRQVFPAAIRVDGSVLQAAYVSALSSDYDVRKISTYDACGQGANGTFLSQSGSQTCNEDSTANKWPVIVKRYYGAGIQLASTAQLRSQHDFQYVHHSTPAVFAAGRWTIGDGYSPNTAFAFGRRGDVAAVTTSGDGFAHIGVFRPSTATWYLAGDTGRSTGAVRFGRRGDVAVQAHYQGLTAPTQLATWRPSTGVWSFASSTGRTVAAIHWGIRGDIPVPGRWLSPSADSIAVFRPSNGTWLLRGGRTYAYGRRGDIPAPADYNGDGRTDIAVYRPSTHTFRIRGHAAVRWGVKGDIPVTGDFNGDGRADLAVYRPSNHTFYVRGVETLTVGSSAATPIGAAPYHE